MSRTPAIVFAFCAALAAMPSLATNWTGGAGADTSWATGANWQGGVAPANGLGGDATFSATAPLASSVPVQWFLTTMTLQNHDWAFSGSDIWFTGNAVLNKSGGGTPTFAQKIYIDNNNSTTLTINNADALTLGPLWGYGPLVKQGAGTLSLPEIYTTGSVSVQAGTLSATSVPSNNDLNIAAGATVTSPSVFWGNLSGAGTLTGSSSVGLLQSANTNFSGTISLPGGFSKGMGGKLTLTGNLAWQNLRVSAGRVQIGNGVSGMWPDNTWVDGTPSGTVTFNLPGAANVRGFSNVAVEVVAGAISYVHGSGFEFNTTQPVTITGGSLSTDQVQRMGAVTVSAPGTWTTGFAPISSLSGNGAIVANGEIQTGLDDSDSTYSGTMTGAVGSLSKFGAGKLTLSGSIQTVGQLFVQSGGLQLQGAAITPSIYLVTGGSTLTGTGTVASTIFVEGGAFLKPTMISAQDLVSGGTLSIAIEGTVPGTQHGQLVLATAPSLSGTTLALTGSHVTVPGESFTIVRNDSGAPVTGTFVGLPQGASILFNGAPLRINYAGGDGNDVTLAYVPYAVTSSSSGNGTITPATTQALPYGAQPQFTLAPAANYHIGGVSGTCGGSLAGNVFTANAIVNDCTVIADFALDSHSVTPSVIGANGAISPNTPQAVGHGTTRQFTLVPDTGYHPTMGGTCPAGSLAGNTYTTGAIVADCSVTASFSINQYTVTAGLVGSNGTVSPTGGLTVNHGSTQQLTVTPATGYSAVIGGSCPVGPLAGTTYTTGTITGDCSVSVSFSLNTYTVTPSAGANGTISPNTAQPVSHGATLQFTVTPSTGYTAVMGGTCPAGSLVGTTYTTGAIIASCTVSVSFTINQYTVTPSGGAGGTFLPATPTLVNYGATLQLTITPDTGHTVVVGGTCPAGSFVGTVYTTGVITTNCTVAVTFPTNQYTVTPSAGANGTISPAAPQGAGHGSTLQFTVTPAAGYKATMGGTCQAGTLVGTLYTTGAITGDCTVSATFDIAYANYTLALEGWQEVGPYVMTNAAGSGTASYNPVTRQLTFNFSFTFIGETGAQVHGPALRGASAPALFSLAPGSPKTDVVTLTPEQEAMLLAGQLYVDLQSFNYPDGHLRAQIDNLGATVLHTLMAIAPTAPGLIQGGTEAGNNLIHCDATYDGCILHVPHGAAVSLAGISGADGYEAHWGGDCSGTADGEDCDFTMDADKTVSATFVSIGVDVSSTFTATPNPAVVGQDVTFATTVHNAGPNVATGAYADIELPAGMVFVSASAGCTGYNDDGDAFVICDAGDLAVGKTKQFTVVLRPTVAGTISISSVAFYDGPDYNGDNQGQTVDLVVNAPTRLGNISTRMRVGTGNDVMIGGFVIGGASNKKVAVVATGPSLTQYGITNALAHPMLTLVRQSDQAVIATNDGWQSAGNAAQLTAAGFAPSNALESAILIDLAPGAYTAIVQGAGGGTGVGIVAVYEVDHPEFPLVNISTRGQVLTGNDVMIGGFIIQGTASQTLAIVATGPSLTQYGITNALANPTLTLVRSSDQAVLATNDDWQSAANAAQLSAAGFAPSNPLEAGILITLPPGAYTAILSGAGGGTGVGVIGVYATN